MMLCALPAKLSRAVCGCPRHVKSTQFRTELEPKRSDEGTVHQPSTVERIRETIRSVGRQTEIPY